MGYNWDKTMSYNIEKFATVYTAALHRFPEDVADIIVRNVLDLQIVILRNHTNTVVFYVCKDSSSTVYHMSSIHAGLVQVICMSKNDKFLLLTGKSSKIPHGCTIDILSTINFRIRGGI